MHVLDLNSDGYDAIRPEFGSLFLHTANGKLSSFIEELRVFLHLTPRHALEASGDPTADSQCKNTVSNN